MDAVEFENEVLKQIERCKAVLIDKSAEYATDTDRLANFKAAAAIQGVSVQQALAGMMAKHTYSIYSMCGSSYVFSEDQWDEKITDHINYLLLLRAVVSEKRLKPWEDELMNNIHKEN